MPADTIYEFRDYTLLPGQREALIDLFEREFIETQEALGSTIVATFRDLDRSDRFVWIRRFADMRTRAAALDGFYTGPTWRTHRSAANATIVDSDNVLLLKPQSGDVARHTAPHPPIGAPAPHSLVLATIYNLEPGADAAFAAHYAAEIAPHLRDHCAGPFATLATEHSPNSYARLPVREHDTVLLTLTHFPSIASHVAVARALRAARTRPHFDRVSPPATHSAFATALIARRRSV